MVTIPSKIISYSRLVSISLHSFMRSSFLKRHNGRLESVPSLRRLLGAFLTWFCRSGGPIDQRRSSYFSRKPIGRPACMRISNDVNIG